MVWRTKKKIKIKNKKKTILPRTKKTKTNKKTENKKTDIFFCTPKNLIAKENQLEKKPITFGLLQHEIDEILTKQNLHRETSVLTDVLQKSLLKILPPEEKIEEKKKTGEEHQQIIVKNNFGTSEYSPYVLDLTALVEKKKAQQISKEKIWKVVKQKETVFCPRKQNRIFCEKKTAKTIILKTPKNKKPSFYHQFTKKPWHYHLNIPYFWPRKALAYLLLGAMIILPIKVFGHYENLIEIKKEVQNQTILATQQLKSAGQNLADDNFADAEKNFAEAETNMQQAEKELASINYGLKAILKILPTDSANLGDAEKIINLTENIAKVGGKMPDLTAIFETDQTLTEKITQIKTNLDELQPLLDNIYQDLNGIRNSAIPENQKNLFATIKTSYAKIYADIKELNDLSAILTQLLGEQTLKRYLFVFQNTNEIRPTGGFIGSLALVDIDRGKIKNLEIPGGGSYDFQGQLTQNVLSPYPLQLINSRWELQDANWFPDFSLSAQKIKWFFEQSGGPTIDGVIAVNSDVISQILEITGPIFLAKHNQTFNSTNVILALQENIDKENKTGDKTKPKQILADLAPELIKNLFDSSNKEFLSLVKLLKNSFDKKQVQVYFKNQSWQEKFDAYDWTGKIKSPSQDYLMVVNSNIGGGKTDAYIKQKINLLSEIKNDGQIINTVQITRTHTGNKNDYFEKTSNLDFVRIYVPKGSKLLKDEGFANVPTEKFEKPAEHLLPDFDLQTISGQTFVKENSQTIINNELNKTVFGNWIQVDPEETKTAFFQYVLPYKLKYSSNPLLKIAGLDSPQNYSVYWQKQSGQKNTDYEISLSADQQIAITSLKGKQKNDKEIFLTDSGADDFFIMATIKK